MIFLYNFIIRILQLKLTNMKYALPILLAILLLSCQKHKIKDTVYYFKAETNDSNPIAVRFQTVSSLLELALCPNTEQCYYWKEMYKNTWSYKGEHTFEIDVLPNSDTTAQTYTMYIDVDGRKTEKSFTLVSGTIKF